MLKLKRFHHRKKHFGLGNLVVDVVQVGIGAEAIIVMVGSRCTFDGAGQQGVIRGQCGSHAVKHGKTDEHTQRYRLETFHAVQRYQSCTGPECTLC